MPKVQLGFSTANVPASISYDSSFPVGLYEAIITEVSDKPAKSGNPMLTVFTKITTPNAAKPAPPVNGATLRAYVTLVESTAWKVAELQHAVGQDGADSIDTDLMLNKKILIRVVQRPNQNGENGPNIDRMLPFVQEEDDLPDDNDLFPNAEPPFVPDTDTEDEAPSTDTPEFIEAYEEYAGWSTDQLRTEAKNLKIPYRGKSDQQIAEALAFNDLQPAVF